MDVWDVVQTCVRRWTVFLPTLALGVGLTFVAVDAVEPDHEASASLILIGPFAAEAAELTDDQPANPYLALGLPVLADTVQRYVDGPEGRRAVQAAGMSTDYDVFVSPRTPIVDFTARAPGADDALATLDEVLEVFDAELERRQEVVNAPPSIRATTQVVTRDSEATPDGGATFRVALVGVIVSLVVAAALAIAIDVSRRRRNAERYQDLQRFRGQVMAGETPPTSPGSARPPGPPATAPPAVPPAAPGPPTWPPRPESSPRPPVRTIPTPGSGTPSRGR